MGKPLKPRHIAIIAPGFPADENDTPCNPALQEYMLGLQKYASSLRVSVLALRYPHRRGKYRWHGLEVFALDGRQRRFPASLPSLLRLVREFRRLRNHHSVDVIHSLWLGEWTMLGALMSRYYGIPHIVTLLGRDVQVHSNTLYRHLLDMSWNTIVAVSQFQRRDLLNVGRDAYEVIPWGIEDPQVKEAVPRDIDVLGVGSLIDLKDFSTFLKVIALLKEVKPRL